MVGDAGGALARSPAAVGRLDVVLALPETLPPLPPNADAAAYRIVTEAVTNVVRHSGASTCRVVVTTDPAGLRLVVEDDGGGAGAGVIRVVADDHPVFLYGLIAVLDGADAIETVGEAEDGVGLLGVPDRSALLVTARKAGLDHASAGSDGRPG